MNLTGAYAMLDMENPRDFGYFEQLAELLECEENIEFDILYTVLSEVEGECIGELIENYFEELTDALDDDENDLVSLLDSMCQNLLLLAEELDKDRVRPEFVRRIETFREWFHRPAGALAQGKPVSVFNAITLLREAKLFGETIEVSFENSLDYELEDTQMVLGSFEKIDI